MWRQAPPTSDADDEAKLKDDAEAGREPKPKIVSGAKPKLRIDGGGNLKVTPSLEAEPKPTDLLASSFVLASYPGLPSQLFSQPWQKTLFTTAAKKAVREGLGTRLALSSLCL